MKFTVQQFRSRYPNDDVCLEEIFKAKYEFEECEKCKTVHSYRRVTTLSHKDKAQRKSYQCAKCGKQVFPLAGTIFEKSRTPLTHWFLVIFLMTTTRNGVAAKEVERLLGVTYKTAFRMVHRIRSLMADLNENQFEEVTQIDEAYIGGSLTNKHRYVRRDVKLKQEVLDKKIKVIGMIEGKQKRAHVKIVDAISEFEVIPEIEKMVKKGTTIVTDGGIPFSGLKFIGYPHVTVRHATDEWTDGNFHTNSIEGFWSALKRMIGGTHIKVTRRYLPNYINECCFRYEHRKDQEGMFNSIVNRIC